VAVTSADGKRFNPLSLDAVNFLLADVRGALGPYLNVFLVTQQHWSLSEVGLVTTIGGLIGLAAQTPIGAAIAVIRSGGPRSSRRATDIGSHWRRPRRRLGSNNAAGPGHTD
jgi:hypothetical protein